MLLAFWGVEVGGSIGSFYALRFLKFLALHLCPKAITTKGAF